MALGFIKKVFSFGKKAVEEIPDPDAAAQATPQSAESTAPTAPVEPKDEAGPSPEQAAPAAADAAQQQPPSPEEAPRRDVEREPDVTERPSQAEASDVAAPRPAEVEAEPAAAPESAPTEASVQTVSEPEPEDAERPVESGAEPPDRADSGALETPPAPADDEPQQATAPSKPPTAPEPPEQADAAPESPPSPQPPSSEPPRGEGKVAVAASVEPVKQAEPEPAEAPQAGWFQRLRQGLARSSAELTGRVTGLLTKRKLDEDTLQDLEDVLIQADLGVETAMRICDTLASDRYGREISGEEVSAIMAGEIASVLEPVAQPLELDLSHKPHVILVVGVNGTGKTTTIGKLAAKLRAGGLQVMLAAGDTFRAAAIEQLHIWGERVGAPVISSKLGADAAGLAWDAYEKAKAAGSDVLIIDTAGRLQNKTELMDELAKIVRVLGKLDGESPHTVLQTLDATTGQNALSQVEIFRNVAGVNGLVMTKLDGTARGGILVAIAARHKLPVYFIGVGEQVDDLEPFSAGDFAAAIAGTA